MRHRSGQSQNDVKVSQIVVSGRKADLAEVVGRMERAVSTMYQWFGQHAMKLNASKTQLLVIGSQQMLRHMPSVYQLLGTVVSRKATLFGTLG